MDHVQLISDESHFMKSKGVAQSQYSILDDGYFEEITKGRWGLISTCDVDSHGERGNIVLEFFLF